MSSFDISGDSGLFKFIFTEDLYVIGDQQKEVSEKEQAPQKTVSTPAQPVKDLAIIVLSNEEKSRYSDFLSKIMQAINIAPALADIYSRDEAEKALEATYKTYISFGEGLRKTGTGLSLKLNQVLSEGKSRFLLTDPLSALENDKEKKKSLWEAMQKGLLNS